MSAVVQPSGVLPEQRILQLQMHGGFMLRRRGEIKRLPLSAQRVLAFLALHDRPLLRVYIAGSLWPASSDTRAAASLRTSVWRLHEPGGDGPIVVSGRHLSLAPQVAVDVRETRAAARRVLSRENEDFKSEDLDQLVYADDLLPDWYEDWILLEREQLREQRVRALERLCDYCTRESRFAEAAQAAVAAVACEPLRETSHRALIRLHLAEGNPGEALRRYRDYCELLGRKLGLVPSTQMEELVASIRR